MLHEGRYYDPLLDDIRALLDAASSHVSGDVARAAAQGNIITLGCRSPHCCSTRAARSAPPTVMARRCGPAEEARAFAHIYATAGVLARTRGGDD